MLSLETCADRTVETLSAGLKTRLYVRNICSPLNQ